MQINIILFVHALNIKVPNKNFWKIKKKIHNSMLVKWIFNNLSKKNFWVITNSSKIWPSFKRLIFSIQDQKQQSEQGIRDIRIPLPDALQTLGTTSSNILESYNGKIKHRLNTNMHLTAAIEELMFYTEERYLDYTRRDCYSLKVSVKSWALG